MVSLETLAADQRAVLQLVLGQERSYDEIGRLLSIDRAAVRERALEALDALGPRTPLRPERRALITDYLLGQLPTRVGEDVGSRLAGVADERAWALAIASELTPMASRPLPEIPAPEPETPAPPEPETTAPTAQPDTPAPPAQPKTPIRSPRAASGAPERRPPEGEIPASAAGPGRGGLVLLSLGALVAVVAIVIIVVVVSSGGTSGAVHSSSRPPPQTTPGVAPTPTSAPRRVIGAVNLTSPTGRARPIGAGQLLQIGSRYGIGIVAQGLPANRHDAYAVWLYNSPSDSRFLGFVNPSVGVNGNLKVGKVLLRNPAVYKQLLLTLETIEKPGRPGRVILRGALKAP